MLSDHAKGWIDAAMRLQPPALAGGDYRDGYRAGIRHRLKDCQDRLTDMGVDLPRLPHIEEIEL